MKREFKSGEVVLEVYDVEKQVDEYLDTIRDFIIEGLISKGNIK